jgi:hypothetical protein
MHRGLAILGGIGTIAYAHLAVSPELHRSVDVARRAVNDAATALVDTAMPQRHVPRR